MTIHTYRVRRVRMYEEATFATDATASIASFVSCVFKDAQLTLDNPRVNTGEMMKKMDAQPYDVLTGYKRATLTLTCNLTGQDVRTTDGVAHVQVAQGMLLRNYLGSERLGKGDIATTGSTATTIVTTTAADWASGAGIALADQVVSGDMIMMHAAGLSTATVTTNPQMVTANIPVNAQQIYGAATYYLGPSDQDSSENKTIQIAVEGLVTTDRFLLLGGKVTQAAFSFPRGEIATATFTIQFANWIYGASAATDLTSDTAPLTFASEALNGYPLPVHHSPCYWTDDAGSNVQTTINPSSIEIGCSPRWVPIPCTAGTNGVLGWARAQTPDVVTASVTVPFESTATWMTERDTYGAGSTGRLSFGVGGTVGLGGCLFYARLQPRNVQIVEVEGLTYQTVDFVGGVPITSDVADLIDSPFYIHMF